MTALLRARDISVARGKRTVVDGVSFTVGEGEVTALLGPNGAGKSTLLEGLAGLLPVQGTLEREGRVALSLQAPDLAQRSVTANVVAALAWWGVPRKERHARAAGALRAFAADHLADRAAATLSGGERRRVHLARALAVRPDVLLLDEPFAGLDVAARAALLEDAGSALRAWTRAALVVVHDRAEAWALADRLLILLDGRIVADGPPQTLLDDPPTLAVARFLGFTGELPQPDGGLLLVRPQQVVLDADGDLEARVERVLPLEDGLRLELAVRRGGRLSALVPLGATAPGDVIRVRVTGGTHFAPSVGDAPLQPVKP